MHVGQTMVCRPFNLDPDIRYSAPSVLVKPQSGRIVYIHPRGRYLVVEFGGRIRESFFPQDVLRWGKEGRY